MTRDTGKAIRILTTLKKHRPNAKTELNYNTPLDFMVAVILSAQATDIGVNKVTPSLFKKRKTPEDYINVSLEKLQKDIKSVNFYKTKAGRIQKACNVLIKNFGGKVPGEMDKLLEIPGIARKSANVILQEIFGKSEGIVVDTHVTRLSNRLGWTKHPKNAIKIEKDLMKLFPKKYWRDIGNQLVHHGRYTCKAKKPLCNICHISRLCPSANINL